MLRWWRVLLALAVLGALSPTTDGPAAEPQFVCATSHTAVAAIAVAELDDDSDEGLRDPRREMTVDGSGPATHRGAPQHLSPVLGVPAKVCWAGRSPDQRGAPTGPTPLCSIATRQQPHTHPSQVLFTPFNLSAGPASVDPSRPLHPRAHAIIPQDLSWPPMSPLTARRERNAPWPS
jgi:hypothetical protein